jgi:hypothetical protein
LVTWKCDSSDVMRASNQRYLSFVALFLDILMAFLGFLSLSAQGSVSTGGHIFYILLAWKWDSWDHQPTCTWLLVKVHSLRFCGMKMRFRKGHEC